MDVFLELAIVVGLILLNGFFAMAELAIVSSRRIRLQQMAEAGTRAPRAPWHSPIIRAAFCPPSRSASR